MLCAGGGVQGSAAGEMKKMGITYRAAILPNQVASLSLFLSLPVALSLSLSLSLSLCDSLSLSRAPSGCLSLVFSLPPSLCLLLPLSLPLSVSTPVCLSHSFSLSPSASPSLFFAPPFPRSLYPRDSPPPPPPPTPRALSLSLPPTPRFDPDLDIQALNTFCSRCFLISTEITSRRRKTLQMNAATTTRWHPSSYQKGRCASSDECSGVCFHEARQRLLDSRTLLYSQHPCFGPHAIVHIFCMPPRSVCPC